MPAKLNLGGEILLTLLLSALALIGSVTLEVRRILAVPPLPFSGLPTPYFQAAERLQTKPLIPATWLVTIPALLAHADSWPQRSILATAARRWTILD